MTRQLRRAFTFCDFPVRDDKMIDKDLESDMQLVLEASTLARSARNAANIKNRQPLSKLYIKAERPLNDYYKAILADELNVKEIDEIDDASGYISYTFKPQLKTLGPKYGKLIGEIRNALQTLTAQRPRKNLTQTVMLQSPFQQGIFSLQPKICL